jgi:8-oxo-dGTP diphosphatase
MVAIEFDPGGIIEEGEIQIVIICANYKGKWIVVRHKDRTTWEIPGGHREPFEDLEMAASRELYEETGALKFNLFPVVAYSVDNGEKRTFGKLFYAGVQELGELPQSEIAEIKFVEKLPRNLTYPLIQPLLYQKVVDYLHNL